MEIKNYFKKSISKEKSSPLTINLPCLIKSIPMITSHSGLPGNTPTSVFIVFL